MDLNQQIVNFLTTIPNIHDSDFRQVLIDSAGLDHQLKSQITYAGPSTQFSQRLVSTLIEYGKLNDGQIALEAFLEATKNFIGQDKRNDCDTFIQTLQTLQKPSSPGIQVTINVEIHKTLHDEDLTESLQQLFVLSTFKNSNRFNLTLSS